MSPRTLLFSLLLLPSIVLAQEELNLANPDTHSYIEASGSRDVHLYTDAEVNEARIYDFYQRQADYYMEQGSWPEIIPAFPGLDAGLHGHWGLHSENDHEDGRWNDIDMGTVWRQTFRTPELNIGKAVSVRLVEEDGISTTFDPLTLSYRVAWDGEYIEFDPFRWGTSRNAQPQGTIWLADPDDSLAWSSASETTEVSYHGFYRHTDRVVFSYDINGSKVLDSPWSPKDETSVLLRTLSFPDGFDGGRHRLGKLPIERAVVTFGNATVIQDPNGISWLEIPELPEGSSIGLAIGASLVLTDGHARYATNLSLTELTQGGSIRWPQTISTQGTRAENPDGKAYVIEAKAGEFIKLVFENPDVMPHNVVFCTEGNLKKVGDMSFAMLNDPKAADKHYTPDTPEVIANSHLVFPGGKHILHFQAPEETGDHHFVCTFPGHWMTMNGIFRVTE